MADTNSSISDVLDEVGPRLRRLRTERGVTLVALAEATRDLQEHARPGWSPGSRRRRWSCCCPSRRAHQVPLDELGGGARGRRSPRATRPAPDAGYDRGAADPAAGRTAGVQDRAPRARRTRPEPRTHEGYEWLYVLAGRLRLVLADRDLLLGAGEAAEFDTRLPHWFGSTGERPGGKLLSLFGSQGERMHVRARPRQVTPGAAGPDG